MDCIVPSLYSLTVWRQGPPVFIRGGALLSKNHYVKSLMRLILVLKLKETVTSVIGINFEFIYII